MCALSIAAHASWTTRLASARSDASFVLGRVVCRAWAEEYRAEGDGADQLSRAWVTETHVLSQARSLSGAEPPRKRPRPSRAKVHPAGVARPRCADFKKGGKFPPKGKGAGTADERFRAARAAWLSEVMGGVAGAAADDDADDDDDEDENDDDDDDDDDAR